MEEKQVINKEPVTSPEREAFLGEIRSQNDEYGLLFRKIQRLQAAVPDHVDISYTVPPKPGLKSITEDKIDTGFEQKVEEYLNYLLTSPEEAAFIIDMILSEEHRPSDILSRVIAELMIQEEDYTETIDMLMAKRFSNEDEELDDSFKANYRIIVPDRVYNELTDKDIINPNFYTMYGSMLKSIMASGTDNKKSLKRAREEEGIFYEAKRIPFGRIVFRKISEDTLLLVAVIFKTCAKGSKRYNDNLSQATADCINNEDYYKSQLNNGEFWKENDMKLRKIFALLYGEEEAKSVVLYKSGGVQ